MLKGVQLTYLCNSFPVEKLRDFLGVWKYSNSSCYMFNIISTPAQNIT